MGKKGDFNNGFKSSDLSLGQKFEIGKKDKVGGITLHGEDFEIIGIKFKFKKGDIIEVVDEKDIILRGEKNEKTKQVKIKVLRDGKYLKNKDIADKKEVPKGELSDDAIFEFNGDIFIMRFLSISDLEQVLDAIRDKVTQVVS